LIASLPSSALQAGARMARWLRAAAGEWSGRHARQRARLDGHAAALLMYHRVLEESEARRLFVEPGMYVTPETFALHLECLVRHFRVLPLSEIVERLQRGASLPEGACAITFDDGWRDNHRHALPALASRGLPATVFVVAGRIGTAGAFWPDEVGRRLAALGPRDRADLARDLGAAVGGDPVDSVLNHLKEASPSAREALLERVRARTGAIPTDAERELLDWTEVEDLARGGVEIESHGLSHAILTGLDTADVDRELCESGRLLRERGYGRHGLLAYPSGAFDEQIQQRAWVAGYRAAVTTRSGLASPAWPQSALPRIALHEDVSRTHPEFHRRVPGDAAASPE